MRKIIDLPPEIIARAIVLAEQEKRSVKNLLEKLLVESIKALSTGKQTKIK